MTAVQDQDATAARPASGIAIVPEQLTRMRDLRSLSRAGLARRVGELLFDRDGFAEVVTGRVQPDAQMARALWLALDVSPHDVLRGLPPGLPVPDVPLWLRRNPGEWTLDTDAVTRLRKVRASMGDTGQIRMWTNADLADAASRHWFSRDMINKIETGARRPSPVTLAAICQVLRCEPADLKEGSDPLPDGETARHLAVMHRNNEMRKYADAKGISYRSPGTGRIRYKVLEKAWAQRAS
jgi:transcriptional regulator with XRE-family HTH domain